MHSACLLALEVVHRSAAWVWKDHCCTGDEVDHVGGGGDDDDEVGRSAVNDVKDKEVD